MCSPCIRGAFEGRGAPRNHVRDSERVVEHIGRQPPVHWLAASCPNAPGKPLRTFRKMSGRSIHLYTELSKIHISVLPLLLGFRKTEQAEACAWGKLLF